MKLLLCIRSYPEARFTSAWLERIDGPARAALLHGELTPQAAEELAAALTALGVPVEREASGTVGATALGPQVKVSRVELANGPATIISHPDAPVPGKPVAQPGDLFVGQEPEAPRPEPEPGDRPRAARRKRKKGEG